MKKFFTPASASSTTPHRVAAEVTRRITPSLFDAHSRRLASAVTLSTRTLVVALFLLLTVGARAAETGRTFATPEEAVAALAATVNHPEAQSLRDLFGPATDELVSTDAVQGKNDIADFAAAFNAAHHLAMESPTNYVLEVGTNGWPFPIPIVQRDGRWFFDTAAGKEELLNRRVGRNELDTLAAVRAYVAAQREYASKDQDGDDVLQYAQKFISSPGKKDGLYWDPGLDGTLSPLGPLMAQAQAEGYGKAARTGTGADKNQTAYWTEKDQPAAADADAGPKPFHGYFFKILTRQGKNAPAGKYDYMINGHLLAGFALVAWPANYGESGVMTLIVNQQGRVYQKDLGPKTASVVKSMTTYDPDPTWTLSNE